MSFPSLKIGDLVAKVPVVQGGMGIGVSMHRLAAAVAAEGAIGVISSAGVALREKDVMRNQEGANIRAMGEEIRKARQLIKEQLLSENAPDAPGIIGVNIMGVLSDFATQVRTSIIEQADVIFSGASLPLDLPKYLLDCCEEMHQDFKTKLVPIVSSARAASIICKKWLSRFDYLPDAVVVEGPLAGGHLGFKAEDLENPDFALEKLIPETVQAMRVFEDLKGRSIPVIAAGGIFTGSDILKFLNLGAAGVQMGTRFVATHECDAHISFKQAYVNATPEDVVIIKSPVGLPGRALRGEFTERVSKQRDKFACQFNCIKTCASENSPYCISKALMNASSGQMDKGFVFCGAKVALVKGIVAVKDLIHTLEEEYDTAKLQLA